LARPLELDFFIAEFYEEALSLVYDLTSKSISPDMWKVLELVYQVGGYMFFNVLLFVSFADPRRKDQDEIEIKIAETSRLKLHVKMI
jgi:hypothetical protein